jgi:hypothetical protein
MHNDSMGTPIFQKDLKKYAIPQQSKRTAGERLHFHADVRELTRYPHSHLHLVL